MPVDVPTNLLAMPLVTIQVETGTNEDWIDALKFLVDDGSEDPPQLDLTGIDFSMEVRRTPPDHEVVLTASTALGTLGVGNPPDFGFLLINIPMAEMRGQQPGKYVADITGTDGQDIRRCVVIDLEIVWGITR
jgi:hypothetical protein